MRHLSTASLGLALLLALGGATTAQEASPEPGASPTPEQLAEAEERLATATCLGQPATIVAIEGFETIGTQGADVIVGTDGDDIIRGEGGNDRICAGPGADMVEGGAGNDRIDGGLGDDQLDGGAGNDSINGGKGADMVTGAAGNDRLGGAAGDDTLDGGKGNDGCVGGPGHDWLPGCNDKRATRGTLVIRRNTTLKGPHRGPIVIAADKVTLDCGGHTVRGPGAGAGIKLNERNGVTVTGCDVTRFTYGVRLSRSDRNTLAHNRAHGNSRNGFAVYNSDKNRLISNVAEGTGFGRGETTWVVFGFELAINSDGNVLKRNKVSGSGTAYYIERSSRNTFTDNIASGSGFNINGDRNIFVGNSVTDAPPVGIVVQANRNVLRDNTVTGSSEVGFQTSGIRNTLTGNTANDNAFVGFDDQAVPGTNSYADNICIDNGEAGSLPEGLCYDTLPGEPEPSPEPGDGPEADGAPEVEE